MTGAMLSREVGEFLGERWVEEKFRAYGPPLVLIFDLDFWLGFAGRSGVVVQAAVADR